MHFNNVNSIYCY